MASISHKVKELVQEQLSGKRKPSAESVRFSQILKEQKVAAAYTNGLSLSELSTFLEKTKGDRLSVNRM